MLLSCFISVTSPTDLKQEVHFIPKGWPVVGRLSSQFGVRQHPIKHRRIFHKGIDIALPLSSRILATALGQVKAVGRKREYGKYVLIDHGHGWQTLYAHLQSSALRAGDWVKRKEMIGRVGQTGLATGPHLHYEVLYLGKPQDPLHFIAESAPQDPLPQPSSHQIVSALPR